MYQPSQRHLTAWPQRLGEVAYGISRHNHEHLAIAAEGQVFQQHDRQIQVQPLRVINKHHHRHPHRHLSDRSAGTTLGGPANGSQTMLTYLYFNGAERTQFGYGATVSVVLFIIISFVFALAYQRYALRRDTAGAVTRAVG